MSKAGPQRETVKHLTYFVVQTFSAVRGAKGKISADDPIPARDEAHARRLVERYSALKAGVVAFRRTGDPKTGDWEDAVVIARYGQVSADVDQLEAADDMAADSWELGAGDLKVA